MRSLAEGVGVDRGTTLLRLGLVWTAQHPHPFFFARHYALCSDPYSPCPSPFPFFPLRWSNYPTLSDSRISLVALPTTHLFFGVAGLRFLRPLCAAFRYQATASPPPPPIASYRSSALRVDEQNAEWQVLLTEWAALVAYELEAVLVDLSDEYTV